MEVKANDGGYYIGVRVGKIIRKVILGNSALKRSNVGCGQGAKVGIGMVVEQ
jgi:hypothetical protein